MEAERGELRMERRPSDEIAWNGGERGNCLERG